MLEDSWPVEDKKLKVNVNHNMKQSVVIIGGNDAIMLGVMRAVGSCGYRVIIVHLEVRNRKGVSAQLDYYSRFVSSYYVCEKGNSKAILELLLQLGREEAIKPVIITLDDFSTTVIDKNLNQLGEYFLFENIRYQEGAIVSLMNKHIQKQIAKSAGFDVVPGWPIMFEGGQYIVPDDIEYPCFVKGLYSYNSKKKNQKKCNNADELTTLLEQCKEDNAAPMYAEPFMRMDKELGVLGVCKKGEVAPLILSELLVMGQGTYHGVSMFGKVSSLEPESKLAECTQDLMSQLDYTGIFNLDIVESNGQLFFVELNFRYAAYGHAACLAGYNIPVAFTQTMLENSISEQAGGQIKTSYYFNDKIGLLSFIDKSISFKEYCAFKRNADYSLVRTWSDPKPSLLFFLRGIVLYIRSRITRKAS